MSQASASARGLAASVAPACDQPVGGGAAAMHADRQRPALAQQIVGHAGAHAAQTDEADAFFHITLQ